MSWLTAAGLGFLHCHAFFKGRSAHCQDGAAHLGPIPTKEQGQNLAPSFGLQFFGRVSIDGASEVTTVAPKG